MGQPSRRTREAGLEAAHIDLERDDWEVAREEVHSCYCCCRAPEVVLTVVHIRHAREPVAVLAEAHTSHGRVEDQKAQ